MRLSEDCDAGGADGAAVEILEPEFGGAGDLHVALQRRRTVDARRRIDDPKSSCSHPRVGAFNVSIRARIALTSTLAETSHAFPIEASSKA